MKKDVQSRFDSSNKIVPLGSREKCIEAGVCVVCQSESFISKDYPIGKKCLRIFASADVRNYKG